MSSNIEEKWIYRHAIFTKINFEIFSSYTLGIYRYTDSSAHVIYAEASYGIVLLK